MIYRVTVNFALNQLEVVFCECVQDGIIIPTTTKVYHIGDEGTVADEVGEVYVTLLNLLKNEQKAVPVKVSMRQARLALLNNGLLDKVSELLTDSKDLIDWEYATEVYRNSALVISLANVLGLNTEQVDDLFVEASKL